MILTIKAEVTPWSEITEAFKKAIKVAKKLDCYVAFDFNGVHCVATPNGDAEKGSSQYHDAFQSKKKFKFASS